MTTTPSQRAREAAAAFSEALVGKSFNRERMEDCRSGKLDDTFVVQAFAQFEAETLERAWQPIETAPRDGREIIVWSTTRAPYYADQDYIETVCEGEHVDKVQIASSYGRDGWAMHSIGTPTHWMPLPPPPQGDPQ